MKDSWLGETFLKKTRKMGRERGNAGDLAGSLMVREGLPAAREQLWGHLSLIRLIVFSGKPCKNGFLAHSGLILKSK